MTHQILIITLLRYLTIISLSFIVLGCTGASKSSGQPTTIVATEENREITDDEGTVQPSEESVPNRTNNMVELHELLEKSSTLQVRFSETGSYHTGRHMEIEATGTATGAIIKYINQANVSSNRHEWVSEVNEKEWHDFISSLYNSGIKWWRQDGYRVRSALDGWGWSLEIHEDSNPLIYSSGYLQYPPNWRGFKMVINNFVEKIRDKKIFLHKAEYEKRFGTPMSYFQSSIKEVRFYGEDYSVRIYLQPIDATITAAFYLGVGRLLEAKKTPLYIDDWLEVVHVLGNIYRECTDKLEWIDSNRQNDTNKITYPLAWDALNEVMDGIKAKIKKNTDVETLEQKLKDEYKKRFGEQISEFERSLERVEFNDSIRHISIERTTNGAVAINEARCWTCLPGNTAWPCRENCQTAEFDISEWLDFVRDLHQIYFKQWEGFENRREGRRSTVIISFLENYKGNKEIIFSGCNVYQLENLIIDSEKPAWRVAFKFSDREEWWYHGTNTYPPSWEKWVMLMSEVGTKVNTQN
jgi:hypothetical protein